MAECIDEIIGSMVHAYELGVLNEEDSNLVEIHLIECPYCNQRFLEFVEATEALRSDPRIRSVIESLAQGVPADAVTGGSRKERRAAISQIC